MPYAVLFLEIAGAALALGLLAAYLAMLGRATLAVVLASVLVAMLLFVTCDLDRPTRGLIQGSRHRRSSRCATRWTGRRRPPRRARHEDAPCATRR